MTIKGWINRNQVSPRDVNRLGEKICKTGLTSKIMEAVIALPEEVFSIPQLAVIMGIRSGRISACMNNLVHGGFVIRLGVGMYRKTGKNFVPWRLEDRKRMGTEMRKTRTRRET